MKYTIDATNKKLGRLATEVAVLLMGKNTSDFARNTAPKISVEVTNLSKLAVSDAKAAQTMYKRFSGYPGGLKVESFKALSLRRSPTEAFRKTVSGMLPKNKLRAVMLKNLTVKE